jgi:hypothetical protein
MAHSNGLNDASRIDDKMLRDVEDGLAVHPVGKPVVSAPASGMGNPAPLGLLCFGMTTGVLYCYMHAPAHWDGRLLLVACMHMRSRWHVTITDYAAPAAQQQRFRHACLYAANITCCCADAATLSSGSRVPVLPLLPSPVPPPFSCLSPSHAHVRDHHLDRGYLYCDRHILRVLLRRLWPDGGRRPGGESPAAATSQGAL